MPLDPSDFPVEVQTAFFIFGFLEDVWDGMSGSYFGKRWDTVEYFFKVYEVREPKTILYIMKMYEGIIIDTRAQNADKKRKADERKSASGGKNFTHNVKG
jgi:hypothetical protein|tara:strand:- start:3435 stop:3734 length:300 start_codon:yes stop_codon:yes gene_type:complete